MLRYSSIVSNFQSPFHPGGFFMDNLVRDNADIRCDIRSDYKRSAQQA